MFFVFLTREALSGALPPSRTVDENTCVAVFPLLLVMHHAVRPYLLAWQMLLPASSWYIISSAAGTGFFWCQLKAQLLKKIKLGPSWVSYVPIGTWIQHSGTDHMIILGTSFGVENPVFLWSPTTFSPTYSTGSFQPFKLWVAFGQLRASYQCFAWFSGIFFNPVPSPRPPSAFSDCCCQFSILYCKLPWIKFILMQMDT